MTTRPSRTNELDLGDLIVLYKGNDSDYRTISVPDFMDKVKDEISDTEFSSYYLRLDKGVLTWSGRTQEDKNKELISAQDFGATGDGVTNDTQSFIDLELQYQGRVVDLLGKRYFVTQDFNKNKYTNGAFKIANERNVIEKTQYDHTDVKFRNNCGNGYPVNEIVSELGAAESTTGTSLFQEFMYHPNTLSYYGTKEYSGDNETELLTLVKYSSNSGKVLSPVLTSNPSNIIGHQGLAHTREGAKTYFWTCGGSDIYAEKGRHVTKFEFNETTLNIENPKHFKLFGDEFVATATRVMDISPSYNTLIAVGSLASDLSLICRVFKVSSLTDPNVDYSNSYTHQFPIKKPDSSLQSCMTDGKFAYFLHSTDLIKTCTVDIYTLEGANILTDDKCALGIDQSNSISHKYWMAGSIFLTPDSEFGMIVGIGKKGGAGTQTPHSSYLMTTKIPYTRVFKNFGTNPAVIFDSPNAIGVAPSSSVKTVELNSDNTQRTRHEITQYIEYMYPEGATGGYSVIQATANDARYYMENTARKGQLQISSSGNLGLWDGTFNKWILYSEPTGDSLISTHNIIPSTTLAKNLGSNTAYWLNTFTKKVTYSNGIFDAVGAGSPESVVTASVGSTYRRTDGSAGSTFYVKESGTGSTGWVAK